MFSVMQFLFIYIQCFYFHLIIYLYVRDAEAVVRKCSVKEVFLKILQNSQENTCARASFLIKLQFIKKQTLAQVFSCEFCELFKNTFFIENHWWLLPVIFSGFIWFSSKMSILI